MSVGSWCTVLALKYSSDISDFPCTIPRTAVANRLIQDAALVQWLAVIVAVLAPMTAWEAFLGHYRSGFSLKAQYAPLLTATLLTIAAAASLVAPGRSGTALQAAGWIGVATGVIGLGYHHYYGVVEKPGGYNWLLHQLMHHAPPLAPLSQAALGALLICAGRLTNGTSSVFGLPIRIWIVEVCAVTILGAVAQSAILHYRGAYNNVLMYIPVTVPLAAAVALAWQGIVPSPLGSNIAVFTLWLTFLSGFVGVGMHIRGIDRQMGGFYLGRANLMQGPPLSAPIVFSGFAGAALAVLQL